MKVNKRVFLKVMLFLGILITSIVGMTYTIKDFSFNPFKSITLENTSMVASDTIGNIYIVSDSNRSVSKIAHDSQLVYKMSGASRAPESFYLITEITADGQGQLYLLENQLDSTGSFIEEEAIHLYDADGNRLSTLFTLGDETQSKLRPAVKGLEYKNGMLTWHVLDDKGITLYSSKSEKPLGSISYDQANVMVQDVKRLSENTIVFVTKDGFVYKEALGSEKAQILFEPSDASRAVRSNLWDVETGSNGEIYLLDVGQFGVFELKNGGLVPVFNSKMYKEGRDEVYFYFNINKQQLVAVNDDNVVVKKSDGSISDLGALRISGNMLIIKLMAYFFILLFLASLVILWQWAYKRYIRRIKLSEIGVTVPLLTAVLVAAIMISYLAVNYYGKIVEDQAISNLKTVVQNSKFVINGNLVEQMNDPTDFNGEVYQNIADELQKLINYNADPWNENLYTAMYTVVNDRYYALVYNDNGVTPFYPFNAFTDEPYFNYFLDAYKGSITTGKVNDADGQWIFSMGPVYNSEGKIVAIVEVGMNKYIFDEWSRGVEKKIVIDIVSMIIVLILLIAELSFLSGWYKSRREHHLWTYEGPPFNNLSILRGLALYIYIAIFMCTPFIPIMAKSIYEPIGNLPMAVTLGLPIFFEVLTTAVTILLAGIIAEKRGWRTIFYLGAMILIGAAIATAMTRSLIWFIAIRGIAGIGNGFIQMTMYAFINLGESETKRNEAFAHMMSGAIAGTNLGFVIGANLAEKIGYFNVFYIMAAFGVIAIVFERLVLRTYPSKADKSAVLQEDEEIITEASKPVKVAIEPEETAIGMPWWQFFFRKDVITFFMLILVPAFLCYMYLEYYFPIFAEDNGLPTAMVGIVFSLYGLFIVYLGPSISTWTEKTLGAKNATAFASFLTGLSLIIFALTGSLAGAILTVLVLALSDSFGETVYTTYFLGLKESVRMGQSIAAGYYEFVQQTGKMLGSLAFGIAIGFGAQLGIGVIGIITLFMSLIFYFAYLGKSSRS